MAERFTFFWSGPFSQWHPCRFVVDGVTYNCAEQFMMAEKARLFRDVEAERRIMAATKPNEQKSAGRRVRGFSDELWLARAKDIVYRGNWAKFSQNPKLYSRLMATQETTLVEASPLDSLWGIGLAETDPNAQDRASWMGQNWLGEILTQVREDLAREGAAPRS